MFPFFCPFFPNIVTFSIVLKGAFTYSTCSIVERTLATKNLLSRVGYSNRLKTGEWRSLCTRNLAPSQSLTPKRLHPKFGTAVPQLLVLPHSLVTSRKRRYAFIVTWDFRDFVKKIIFFNIV